MALPTALRSSAIAALVLFSTAVGTPALAQPLQCEIDGASVNPANGHTTQGKTGLMRCRDAEGRLQREEEIRNGAFIGLRRFHRPEGIEEYSVNAQGNRDGVFRAFHPDGKLREESMYANGSPSGISKRWYASGQLERIAYFVANNERSALEYVESGQLRSVQCARRSLMTEDREPCGFVGTASSIELFGGRRGEPRPIARVSYAEGQLVARDDLDANGAPSRSYSLRDGIETTRELYPGGKQRRERSFTAARDAPRSGTEREWAENGQIVLERRFKDGAESGSTTWYMNGNVRETRTVEGRGREAIVRVEHFYDTGRPRTRWSMRGSQLIGRQESFDEAGRLREESVYDERGVRRSRRTFDEQGALKTDEEFFEDGSRKLPR